MGKFKFQTYATDTKGEEILCLLMNNSLIEAPLPRGARDLLWVLLLLAPQIVHQENVKVLFQTQQVKRKLSLSALCY